MTLGEDCRGLEAKLGKATESLMKNGIRCHNCDKIFKKDDDIYVHEDDSFSTFPVCHKECRESLPKPEPEVSEKHYDKTDEHSSGKWFPNSYGETYYGYPVWTDDEELELEEMWKNGKSIEEIASTLDRSENAIRIRIKRNLIQEKTGRYLEKKKRKPGSGGGRIWWTNDKVSKLEEMWKNGKSIEEIASTLDRSENSILNKIREEQIEEKTGRLRPATKRQLDWLDAMEYDGPEPTDIEDAKKIITEMEQQAPSDILLRELSELGYDGPPPETNREAEEEIAKRQEPTPNQLKLIKKIFEKAKIRTDLGIHQLPTNKFDARNILRKQEYQKFVVREDDLQKCSVCYGRCIFPSGIVCLGCDGEGTKEAYDMKMHSNNDKDNDERGDID